MESPTSSLPYQTRLIEVSRDNLISLITGVTIVLCAMITATWFIFNRHQPTSKALHPNTPSPSLQPTSTPTPSPLAHIVQKGEDICTIATTYYGDCEQSHRIIEANDIDNPEQIEINQRFVIPPIPFSLQKKPTPTLADIGEISAITSDQVQNNSTFYIVQPGDTLYIIAEKMYGDGNAWPIITEANKLTSGEDIEVGQELVIPR